MNHAVFIAHGPEDSQVATGLKTLLAMHLVSYWDPGESSDDRDVTRAILDARLVIYVHGHQMRQSPAALKQLSIAAEVGRDIVVFREDHLPGREVYNPFRDFSSPRYRDERVYSWLFEFIGHIQHRLGMTPTDLMPAPLVRVAVHFAYFITNGARCCFINVMNLSCYREIEITQVWLELHPKVLADPYDRPLPKRLQPQEVWETWVPCPEMGRYCRKEVAFFNAARVRLSSGEVIESERNYTVGKRGVVPGGPVLAIPRLRRNANS